MKCPKCDSLKSKSNGGKRRVCLSCGATFAAIAGTVAKREAGTSKRYFVTCAVSQSPVHAKALAVVERYCADMQAELVIVPINYQNNQSKLNRKWAKSVIPFLRSANIEVGQHLVIAASVSVQPTAAKPLSGMHSITGKQSMIIGHPHLAQEYPPTASGKLAKMIATTGSITYPRYTRSKAGAKGDFHHVMGGVIVEVEDDGETFYPRHVFFAKDGSFQDLHTKWTAEGPCRGKRAESLVFGDLHAVNRDKSAFDFQFGATGLATLTNPRNIFLHDTMDGQSISHHTDYFGKFRKHVQNLNLLAVELTQTFEPVQLALDNSVADVWVVPSNHDEWFERWLKAHENANDLPNAIVYHETKLALLTAIAADLPLTALEYWGRRLLGDNARLHFLHRGDKMTLSGVDHAQHGDRGPHGSRGSRSSLAKTSAKMNVGHAHSPGREDGIVQAGTSSKLEMDYNRGEYSGWFHTHILQFEGGKRTLVNIVGGKFRRTDKLSARLDALS